MDAKMRAQLAEQLGELLILAEPEDAASMEALRSALVDVETGAGRAQDTSLATAAADAAAFLGRLTKGALPDVHGAMTLLATSVEEIRAGLLDQGAGGRAAVDADLLQEFVSRALEHLEAADEQLLVLERDRDDREAIDSIFRAFHTIKGMTGFLSLDAIRAMAHEGESALEPIRAGESTFDDVALDRAFSMVDQLRAATMELDTRENERPDDFEDTLRDGASEAAQSQARPAAVRRTRSRIRETVRVDAERLDQLLDAIGELVIAESMASRTTRLHEGLSADLAQQLGRLDKLTRQLHEMAGSLRMVPMRPTFQRLARAVRDVSRSSGKTVSTVISGAETELDKAVVDRISDPLLHLVRNAVDHGIESSSDRKASGKPAAGRIDLRAYHRAGSIYLEVEDDGGGIDRDRVLEKARAVGLVPADETPTDKELFALLFLPGFSTSEIVTDVSGRGVGMDVVKRTVDALSGQVSVRSEGGRGTVFTLRLPITLAVIDGMAVRVGAERYIVPTLSVVRSVRPERVETSTVLGSGEMLRHGDELLRLIRLGELFSLHDAETELADSIVMVVEDEGERAGLVIDEILGQQQIVIKSLGDALGDVPGISGGAVMPDGSVGLILDVEGLVRLANQN